MCIVLQLPARVGTQKNDQLYRVAIVGQGYHGLIVSPTTHIPGLLSIVDVAPTALHRSRRVSRGLRRATRSDLASLGEEIHSNDQLKTTALWIVAGLLLLLALLGVRAAVTAVPAALLVNLGLGVAQVSNQVLLVAGIAAGTALLAFALARVCRSDDALLLLYGGVVFLYAATMVPRTPRGRRSTRSARRRTRGTGGLATSWRPSSSCRSSPGLYSPGGGSGPPASSSSVSSVSS